MPGFQYKAIDRIGRPARGKLDAANEVDLELRLKRMGLDLITFRTVRAGGANFAKGSVTRRDLITFCFDLEQISRSGFRSSRACAICAGAWKTRASVKSSPRCSRTSRTARCCPRAWPPSRRCSARCSSA